MKNNSIAVIGAGKWGQALHFALSQKQEVLITSRTKKDIKNFVFNGQKILVASKGIEASSGQFLNEIYADFVPTKNMDLFQVLHLLQK